MESHVAHCPKRLTALAQAKTQPCPGKGCRERIVGGDAAPVLCPTCWALLPPTISAWVAREASRKPRTPDYLEAVAHARKVVGTIRAHPRPAATLFPGVEYG